MADRSPTTLEEIWRAARQDMRADIVQLPDQILTWGLRLAKARGRAAEAEERLRIVNERMRSLQLQIDTSRAMTTWSKSEGPLEDAERALSRLIADAPTPNDQQSAIEEHRAAVEQEAALESVIEALRARRAVAPAAKKPTTPLRSVG